jgi:hypothetical protein
MRTVILLLFLLLPVCAFVQPAAVKVQQIYTSQIGVREATGKNDGKQVEAYLRATGLGKGYSWCAAFVRWCFDQAGVKTSITAWSPSAHNSRNVVYHKRQLLKQVQPADVFTLWYSHLKRVGHTGFVDRIENSKVVVTVEGNTNQAGSREGDGVYLKKRSLHTIHSITRWL